MSRFTWMRRTSVACAIGVLVAVPATGAWASEDVLVTNRESVQAFLKPDGSMDTARVYDQLTAFGTGTVRIENPVATDGLRNLDGFGGFSVEDDRAIVEMDVDGEANFRTVSDFRGELPVSIEPEYRLDGQLVEARDIVGKSGTLDVRYTIRNETAQPTPVTYFDGTGSEVTITADVPLPLVGIFETTLPPSFSSVQSSNFNIAGDGRGGTVLRANLVLFDGLPTGGSTANLFYTAEITDGILPEAQLDVTPVQPISHANFDGAFQASAQGAQSARTLVRGTTQMDDGLAQLHDGAADLLDGLILIAEGTDQLRAGLADEAAPGARQLADGAGQAATGARDLSEGLNQRLAPGARELAGGAAEAGAGAGALAAGLNERLAPGARQLADGARLLESGLEQLAGGLPDAHAGTGQLMDGITDVLLPGVQQVLGGLGSLRVGVETFEGEALAGVDGTIASVFVGIGALEAAANGGLDQLLACINGSMNICRPGATPDDVNLVQGVGRVLAGIDRLSACIDGEVTICDEEADPAGPNLRQGVAALQAGVGVLQDGVGQVHAGLAAGLHVEDQANPLHPDNGSLVRLAAAINGIYGLRGTECVDTCETLIEAIIDGGFNDPQVGLIGSLTQARGGLAQVLAGLGELEAGLAALNGGLGELDAGAARLRAGVEQVRGGLDALAAGIDMNFRDQIAGGAQQFRTQVESGGEASKARFSAGFGDMMAGVDRLLSGVGDIDGGVRANLLAGLEQLEAGLFGAAEGAAALHAGAGQLAGGTGDLAAGAGDAASGAQQLADGLNQRLAPGARQLADGAAEAGAGAQRLASGNRDIADGALRLADGVQAAADGATQLGEGAASAAEGTPALVDGIWQVKEGIGMFNESGSATVGNFAPNVAMLQASSARGAAEAMPIGAPEDAVASAAYSITLTGAAGEGSQNLVRAAAAVALLALVAGAVALARRRAGA